MYNVKNIFLASLFYILLTCCTATKTKDELPRSSPEAEGVSSEAILKFVEAAEKGDNGEIHSFMFLRHGKVIAEGWWNPYRADLKHNLYSLSKSFVSTAIGFAVTEKRLTVNDKVISFFPEELPDTITPFLSELTVKDLLTMSVGQVYDPTFIVLGSDSSWVKTFLAIPIVNKPGSKFLYNSIATYMLSTIIQKVTGEKTIDYLTTRLFVPLRIEGMDWEESPQGINVGGWGLSLKTEDLTKIGQLYLQNGSWNGKQILPKEWIEEATTFKIEQAPQATQAEKNSSDKMQGFCYQFKRCRNNAYRGDGAFGQFLVVMPDQDAVIAITSETVNMWDELNLVWEYLLPAMHKDKLPTNNEAVTILRKKLSSLALPLPEKSTTSSLLNYISGKTFVFEPNERHLKSMSFNFMDSICHVSLKIDTTEHLLTFALGSWHLGETHLPVPSLLPDRNESGLISSKVAGNYYWKNNNTVELTLRYIESPHSERIICSFDQNKVSISMRVSFKRNNNNPELKGEFQNIILTNKFRNQ